MLFSPPPSPYSLGSSLQPRTLASPHRHRALTLLRLVCFPNRGQCGQAGDTKCLLLLLQCFWYWGGHRLLSKGDITEYEQTLRGCIHPSLHTSQKKFVISWQFLHIGSCHLWIKIVLDLSFQSGWFYFVGMGWSWWGVVPLARHSSTILKWIGKSWHLALLPILRKTFIFTSKYYVQCKFMETLSGLGNSLLF